VRRHFTGRAVCTCFKLRSSSIPRRNLESARCSARSDGIARSINSVEGWHHGLQALFQCYHLTVWTFMSGIHTAGHPAPESTVSAGYDWRKPPVCKKVSCTERSSCASYRSVWPRCTACIASFDCVLVACIDIYLSVSVIQ